MQFKMKIFKKKKICDALDQLLSLQQSIIPFRWHFYAILLLALRAVAVSLTSHLMNAFAKIQYRKFVGFVPKKID